MTLKCQHVNSVLIDVSLNKTSYYSAVKLMLFLYIPMFYLLFWFEYLW